MRNVTTILQERILDPEERFGAGNASKTGSVGSQTAKSQEETGGPDRSTRAGQRVLATLRRMISGGELAAGARVAELTLAAQLGVSRMPIRMAFRALAQEGLLVRSGARGFAVRAVSRAEIAGAVEVRGVLEGLAARLVTEAGVGAETLRELKSCLADGDALLGPGQLSEDDAPLYLEMNIRFHAAIMNAAGNAAILDALSRNDHLPFASVRALAINRHDLAAEYRRLNYAHMQHHAIVEAITAGQGARAEALMREHAQAVLRYTPLDTAQADLIILREKGAHPAPGRPGNASLR